MSHSRYIGVLAHYQPLDRRPATSVPEDIAELLVQRMAAERISQKLIRMMPPDSIFAAAGYPQPEPEQYIPVKLPAREVANCKFINPKAAPSTIARLHLLPRFREIYGELQLEASLVPNKPECSGSLIA